MNHNDGPSFIIIVFDVLRTGIKRIQRRLRALGVAALHGAELIFDLNVRATQRRTMIANLGPLHAEQLKHKQPKFKSDQQDE